MPRDFRGLWECRQWVHWQMANLGPLAGQNHHFVHYAPEKIPYAIDRYVRETGRLYRVLDRRLADRAYLAGDYSIADILCYPWVLPRAPVAGHRRVPAPASAGRRRSARVRR